MVTQVKRRVHQESGGSRYTRNLVDQGNGKFNLMILCWGEGHGSAIHDHADSHCFMKVLQGSLSEVRFSWPEDSPSKDDDNIQETGGTRELNEICRNSLRTNDVCYINDSLGIHRVENTSHTERAVSLHLYCPPFDTCSVFNQNTGRRSKCQVTFWSKFGDKRNRVVTMVRSDVESSDSSQPNVGPVDL
uniref:Cysteine dioxygenase n=1 Tax=Timema shepardi TaxID=629360 RepID=A0A7R9B0Q5_TIMSH|nr:unnamed protein product [Timema shepardi]